MIEIVLSDIGKITMRFGKPGKFIFEKLTDVCKVQFDCHLTLVNVGGGATIILCRKITISPQPNFRLT